MAWDLYGILLTGFEFHGEPYFALRNHILELLSVQQHVLKRDRRASPANYIEPSSQLIYRCRPLELASERGKLPFDRVQTARCVYSQVLNFAHGERLRAVAASYVTMPRRF